MPDYRGEKGLTAGLMYEPLGLNYYDAANQCTSDEVPPLVGVFMPIVLISTAGPLPPGISFKNG